MPCEFNMTCNLVFCELQRREYKKIIIIIREKHQKEWFMGQAAGSIS